MGAMNKTREERAVGTLCRGPARVHALTHANLSAHMHSLSSLLRCQLPVGLARLRIRLLVTGRMRLEGLVTFFIRYV